MILTAAILFSVTFFIPFIAILNKGAIPEFLKTIGGRIEEAFPKSLSLIAKKADTAIKPESYVVDEKPALIIAPVATKVVDTLKSHKSSISNILEKGVYQATLYYKLVSQWLLGVIENYKLDEFYRAFVSQSLQLIEWTRLPQLWLYIKNTMLFQYLNERLNYLLNEWQMLLQKNESFVTRFKSGSHQFITDYIEDKFDSALDVYRYGTKQEKFDLSGELLVYSLTLMFAVNLILHLPALYRALVQDAIEFFRNARTISQQDTTVREESASEYTAVSETTEIRITKQQEEEIAEFSVTTTNSYKCSFVKEEAGNQKEEEQKELISEQLQAFELTSDYPIIKYKNILQDNKVQEQKNNNRKKNSILIPVEKETDQQQDNENEKVNVIIREVDQEMNHSSGCNSQGLENDVHELKEEDFQEQYESFNELESLKSAFKGKDLSDQLNEALNNDIRNDFNASSTRSLSASSSMVQGNLEGSPDSSISPGDEIFIYTPVRANHSRLSFSSTIGKSLISPSKLIYAPTNTPTSIVNDSHVYSDIIVPNSPQKKIEESIKKSVFSDVDSVISDGSPESSISIE